MVLVFRSIIDFWRLRLWELNRRWSSLKVAPWHVRIERKVLRFLLKRYADGPNSDPPRTAEPLDSISATNSQELYLSDDAREQLGLPRINPVVVDIIKAPKPAPEEPYEPPTPGYVVVYDRRTEEKAKSKPFDDAEKEKAWRKLFEKKPKNGGSVWS